MTNIQATQVSSLNTLFSNNTDIIYFNELSYFNNLVFLKHTNRSTGEFENCTNLKEITLPISITKLTGYSAFVNGGCFYHCSNLTKINLENIETMEGGNVFNGCSSLTEINMPKLTSVDATDGWGGNMYYFYKCISIKYANIPLLKILPNSFFEMCSSLESVTCDTITYLGAWCFVNDAKLTSLNISNCTIFKQECLKNTPLLTDITFNDNTELIEVDALDNNGWYNSQSNGLIRIGKVLYKYKGTAPENTSIVIPDDIVYITEKCFINQSNIVSVTMNDTITTLNSSTFRNCTSLKTIDLKNITTIPDGCFQSCSSLESIDLSKVINYNLWSERMFETCTSLKTVKLNTILTDLTVVDGIFNKCTSLVDDINLENITKFGRENFSNCTSFKGTTIQFDKVSVILYNCFLYCSSFTQNLDLQKLVICEVGIFSHCSNLSSVHLYNVTKIDKFSFEYCTSLRYIRIDATTVPTLVDINSFDQDTCNFYVLDDLVDSYKTAKSRR